MKQGSVLAMFLSLLVFGSALSVVYSKHLNRKLFVELGQLEQAHDELQVEWGRLQLEHSTWASHDRIRQLARSRLQLHTPSADSIVLVKP
ncbi:MAG: cell division protein FtsL [Gammaproteobacteria bacterium]|jgi:cell division protein FtsL|nr:cell division protein FtsL [Gammaproteobacteria bacterium]